MGRSARPSRKPPPPGAGTANGGSFFIKTQLIPDPNSSLSRREAPVRGFALIYAEPVSTAFTMFLITSVTMLWTLSGIRLFTLF
jgi:hypothetical protein